MSYLFISLFLNVHVPPPPDSSSSVSNISCKDSLETDSHSQAEVSESRGQPKTRDTYQRSESDGRSGVKVFLRARQRQWVSGYSEIRHKKLEYKEWAPTEPGLSSGG